MYELVTFQLKEFWSVLRNKMIEQIEKCLSDINHVLYSSQLIFFKVELLFSILNIFKDLTKEPQAATLISLFIDELLIQADEKLPNYSEIKLYDFNEVISLNNCNFDESGIICMMIKLIYFKLFQIINSNSDKNKKAKTFFKEIENIKIIFWKLLLKLKNFPAYVIKACMIIFLINLGNLIYSFSSFLEPEKSSKSDINKIIYMNLYKIYYLAIQMHIQIGQSLFQFRRYTISEFRGYLNLKCKEKFSLQVIIKRVYLNGLFLIILNALRIL